MDYNATIDRVYEHLENDQVHNAAMVCLRLARNLNDYMNAAIFLRELHTDMDQFSRVFYDDTNHLKKEVQKYLWGQSLKQWLEGRTLDDSPIVDDEDRRVMTIGAGECDPEIEQLERSIQDKTVPSGMGEFDTAAFTDRYVGDKTQLRLRIRAVQTIKERIKTRCLNYAIRLERQLQAQRKSVNFLQQIQNEVNNHFKAHSDDVYTKLQKAAQLVDSTDTEDSSLLLTEVRRAIKAAADYFFPPRSEPVKCADGEERKLDDARFLNRLQEYLASELPNDTSGDLLSAELDYLVAFARKLNDVASKGVHAEVSPVEAKQGLLGLYMFLFNVISRLEKGNP